MNSVIPGAGEGSIGQGAPETRCGRYVGTSSHLEQGAHTVVPVATVFKRRRHPCDVGALVAKQHGQSTSVVRISSEVCVDVNSMGHPRMVSRLRRLVDRIGIRLRLKPQLSDRSVALPFDDYQPSIPVMASAT